MSYTSIVVMGVSGSGKSTIGALLAARLGLPFVDGDTLHSPASKQKMAHGQPLGDADRAPWLAAIGELLARAPVVVACSALKRAYRDMLRDMACEVKFIYLSGSKEILLTRMAGRAHEFMPPGLLDSQLLTLEPPQSDEKALHLDIDRARSDIVDAAAKWLAGLS